MKLAALQATGGWESLLLFTMIVIFPSMVTRKSLSLKMWKHDLKLWVRDGNKDYDAIRQAIADAKAVTDRPTLIKVSASQLTMCLDEKVLF